MARTSSEYMTLETFRESLDSFVEELKQDFEVWQYAKASDNYSYARAYECHLMVEPEGGAGWKAYFKNYLTHKALKFWPEGEIYDIQLKADQDREDRVVCIFTIAFDSYREGPYRS